MYSIEDNMSNKNKQKVEKFVGFHLYLCTCRCISYWVKCDFEAVDIPNIMEKLI